MRSALEGDSRYAWVQQLLHEESRPPSLVSAALSSSAAQRSSQPRQPLVQSSLALTSALCSVSPPLSIALLAPARLPCAVSALGAVQFLTDAITGRSFGSHSLVRSIARPAPLPSIAPYTHSHSLQPLPLPRYSRRLRPRRRWVARLFPRLLVSCCRFRLVWFAPVARLPFAGSDEGAGRRHDGGIQPCSSSILTVTSCVACHRRVSQAPALPHAPTSKRRSRPCRLPTAPSSGLQRAIRGVMSEVE